MTWTTPADLRLQVQKLWNKGDLLRPCVHGAAVPPLRLRLTGPSSTELAQRFDDVRGWMKALGCNAAGSEAPRYRADIVRLIHGDANPKGPGIKETVVDAPSSSTAVVSHTGPQIGWCTP